MLNINWEHDTITPENRAPQRKAERCPQPQAADLPLCQGPVRPPTLPHPVKHRSYAPITPSVKVCI